MVIPGVKPATSVHQAIVAKHELANLVVSNFRNDPPRVRELFKHFRCLEHSIRKDTCDWGRVAGDEQTDGLNVLK